MKKKSNYSNFQLKVWAYLKKIPPSISRSFDGEVNYIPHENIGSKTSNIALIKGSPQVQPILPDSRFNPMALEAPIPRSINLKTLLGVGIPLSTFCIRTTLGHLGTIEERLALARQLLLQAEVIKYKKLSDQFKSTNFKDKFLQHIVMIIINSSK